MAYITKEIAKTFESCFKQTHIEVTKLYPQGKILELETGAACFSGFDSYLSQVVGWGFDLKPSLFESEIKGIENFYKSLNHSRIDVELSPFVGNNLAFFLSQRGYQITELNTVSFLDLSNYKITDLSQKVQQVEDQEIKHWAKAVAIGFDCKEAQTQFTYYAKAKGVVAFAIFDLDKIIAGATVAIHGEACDLGVTSTLPSFRGRGLQKQLILARLNLAKKQGLKWAVVTTEPGSISDLNVQKMGFRNAYTRIKLTRFL